MNSLDCLTLRPFRVCEECLFNYFLPLSFSLPRVSVLLGCNGKVHENAWVWWKKEREKERETGTVSILARPEAAIVGEFLPVIFSAPFCSLSMFRLNSGANQTWDSSLKTLGTLEFTPWSRSQLHTKDLSLLSLIKPPILDALNSEWERGDLVIAWSGF